MNWTQQFDAYCERTDLTLWSEPINAVTNLAFLVAALVMWRRTSSVPGGRLLCVILFAIGLGSALFHTLATGWAAMADNLPILSYILVFIYLVHKDILRLSRRTSILAVVAFVPFAAGVVMVLRLVPFFAISSFYWSVPILLLIYAAAMRRRWPQVSRGFVTGAAILILSIVLRSLDEILCTAWPIGTHFCWHILNAVMLGFMIHVYTAHVLAGREAAR